MRVSSPIGDFPFEARRLRVDRDGLVVEGAMGAWPATIERPAGRATAWPYKLWKKGQGSHRHA